MYKIFFVFLFLLVSTPAKADVAFLIDSFYPSGTKLPFYIFVVVLGLITFISLKIELKKSQEEQEIIEENKKE